MRSRCSVFSRLQIVGIGTRDHTSAGPPPTNGPFLADQLVALRRSLFLEQYDCHPVGKGL
jgi:hypothetical protein